MQDSARQSAQLLFRKVHDAKVSAAPLLQAALLRVHGRLHCVSLLVGLATGILFMLMMVLLHSVAGRGLGHNHPFQRRGLDLNRWHRAEGMLIAENVDPPKLLPQLHYEHLASMRETKFHEILKDRWSPVGFSKPYLRADRTSWCNLTRSDAAAMNDEAVADVRRALAEVEYYPLRLDHHVASFRTAATAVKLGENNGCPTPRLNQLMLQLFHYSTVEMDPNSGNGTSLLALRDGLHATWRELERWEASHARVALWRGVVSEYFDFPAPGQFQRFYAMAKSLDPSIGNEYFHPQYNGRLVGSPSTRMSQRILARHMIQVLVFYEFAPALGASASLPFHATQEFRSKWYAHLSASLPKFVLACVTTAYRQLADLQLLNNVDHPKGPATDDSSGDVVNTFLNVRIGELISRLSGIAVRPSYGYTALYRPGDTLQAHTDRKACEFTISILIEAYPTIYPCSLYLADAPLKIDDDYVGYFLDAPAKWVRVVSIVGDIAILRGRAVNHWRPRLPANVTCSTLLLHYTGGPPLTEDWTQPSHQKKP